MVVRREIAKDQEPSMISSADIRDGVISDIDSDKQINSYQEQSGGEDDVVTTRRPRERYDIGYKIFKRLPSLSPLRSRVY